MGHARADLRFISNPLQLAFPAASNMWQQFHQAADTIAEDMGPSRGAGIALEKHGYTTGSHIILNHLFKCSMGALPASDEHVHGLLMGSGADVERAQREPLSNIWYEIQPSTMLSAPRHIFQMARSLVTIFNEMALPLEQRAGSEAISHGLDREEHPWLDLASAPAESKDFLLLKRILQQNAGRAEISVTQARRHLPSTGRGQDRIRELFALGERLGVGAVLGGSTESCSGRVVSPSERLRFRIDVATLDSSLRVRLGLDAVIPEAAAIDVAHIVIALAEEAGERGNTAVPHMRGGGKRANSNHASEKLGGKHALPAVKRLKEASSGWESMHIGIELNGQRGV